MSEQDRKKRIEQIRKEWEGIRDSGLVEQFKERMMRKAEGAKIPSGFGKPFCGAQIGEGNATNKH